MLDLGPLSASYVVVQAYGPAGPFLARDTRSGDPVVAHVFAGAGDVIARVEPARGVLHEGVLRVRDVAGHQGAAVVVTDVIEGANLAALLAAAGGALPFSIVARVLHDVVAAVVAVHKAGVVHGGLQAHSVVVGLDGRARVVDLAPALLFRPVGAEPRLDLRLVGLLGLEILCGRRFPVEAPPLVVEVCPGAPAALERAIERLLAPGPCAVAAVLDELGRFLAATDAAPPYAPADALRDPAAARAQGARAAATAELLRAERTFQTDDEKTMRHAGWALYRACALDPATPRARDAFDRWVASGAASFAPPQNPRLQSLEARLHEAPVGVLKTATDQYLAERNLLGAVRMMKRALRVKPDDALLWSKLRDLIGESDGSEPYSLAAHPTGAFLEDLVALGLDEEGAATAGPVVEKSGSFLSKVAAKIKSS